MNQPSCEVMKLRLGRVNMTTRALPRYLAFGHYGNVADKADHPGVTTVL